MVGLVLVLLVVLVVGFGCVGLFVVWGGFLVVVFLVVGGVWVVGLGVWVGFVGCVWLFWVWGLFVWG
ncbi:hypothetical protein, partial [Neisseria sp. P0016.S006]|uniref:hypothetical protein n=1 Tax=Neisseria sp. P0016.S006 TaxID=3436772 RepID=UPI003F7FA00C